MGIGGAGMSALALLLQARGFNVSGCDLKSPHYDLHGITCDIPHSPAHITHYNPDALILSTAVRRDNPEVLAAKTKGLPVYSRAQALSYLFNSSYGIGIAGTHGKTTTTSMAGLVFLKSGRSPTLYVGANVPDIGTNAVSGTGRDFIAELDESDGTFELFTPNIAVITNADWDHVDHYPTREDGIRAFVRFADGRKEGGALILCAEDEGANHVCEMCGKGRGEIVRYGWGRSWDWGAYDITKTHGGGISCMVSHHGREIGTLTLSVSGEHNILNALAAISAADLCGIDFGTSAEILRGFHGSERRMQVKGTTASGVLVMDDYAHHPSEIQATIEAVRGIYPERRLVVVYQPHRFTRTAMFAGKIAEALGLAGKAYVLPVYAASEEELPHSNSDEIIRLGMGRIHGLAFDDAPDTLRDELKPGDLLLTMGAGDVYMLGENFLTVNQNV